MEWKGYFKKNLDYELINGNGNVKVYKINEKVNNLELIFEGEFLNGQRNGKGEDHENGRLKYIMENLRMEKEMAKENNIKKVN